MESASFTHVEPDGRFQFHKADGSLVVVHGDKPYRTSDAHQIAFLNESPFVKLAEKAKG